MFRIFCPRINRLQRCSINSIRRRFFLSKAYKCEEAWANRLKSPIFQKTELSSLYHELDICFERKERVSVLDIDLLISGVKDASFRNEIDEVLLKVRLTPECRILPERATHAAIRWYMDHVPAEELLNVLSDRLNYGLFPDHYLNNLLMDKYLKENDAMSAVKIAVLQMFQEDFEHPIMKTLALYCCYNYLNSSVIWESYKEPEPDPDEEVKKVRVNFVADPYFDDHFDIVDTNHLVGKTLWLFGRNVEGAVGVSSQLVGLVLYEKYNKCIEVLEKIIQEGKKLHAEAVEKTMEYALKKPKQLEEEKSKDEAKDIQKEAKSGSVDEPKAKLLELLKKVEKKNLEAESLLSASAELVRKAVKENESADIECQCKLYQKWEADRENHIQKEMQRAKIVEVNSRIAKMKENLKEEEDKLFFFDREEEFQLQAEEKEKEKQSIKFYVGKGKHREQTTTDYIPPQLKKTY